MWMSMVRLWLNFIGIGIRYNCGVCVLFKFGLVRIGVGLLFCGWIRK